MSILNVAQKNSVAKQVANILSRGRKSFRKGVSKYNPVYQFKNDQNETVIFTSVRGHVFTQQLPEYTKSWATFDNKKILQRDEVPIHTFISDDMSEVAKNIENNVRGAKILILWLDCDRQGQAIAFEVIEICQKINRNIKIQRARFAALTAADIWYAYNHLVQPNVFEARAVSYRSEIDFRLGCTFSRYQTLAFRKVFKSDNSLVLSYGPCQIPTLGFVAQRYLQIKNFKSQPYWAIKCFYYPPSNTNQSAKQVEFKWQRKTSRNVLEVYRIFVGMFQKFEDRNIVAHIQRKDKTEKKKYRPYPLTTVTLQKIGTDKLRMSSSDILNIAEKLYQKGFISYPRTQTNSFPNTMNLENLAQRLQSNPAYGHYVNALLTQGKFQKPKVGKNNDHAHTPIHPVRNANKQQLDDRQFRVYDIVCRHFLACCSKDAVGEEFQVTADVGGQIFTASYLTVLQKNYLQIYVFQRWNESYFSQIPDHFQPLVKIVQSKTSPPSYLTESDLISLMEKNQIGTDATIAEHIQTIQKREYALKNQNTFKPTNLGLSLIVAYRKFQIKLPECEIRSMIQKNMDKIANQELDHTQATIETLNMMIPIYQNLKRIEADFVEAMKKAIQDHQDLKRANFQQMTEEQRTNTNTMFVKTPTVFRCPLCKKFVKVRSRKDKSGMFLGCVGYPDCKYLAPIIKQAQIATVSQNRCPKCQESRQSALCVIQISLQGSQSLQPESLLERFFISQLGEGKLSLCLYPGCDRDLTEFYSTSSYFRPQGTNSYTNSLAISKSNLLVNQNRNITNEETVTNPPVFSRQNLTGQNENGAIFTTQNHNDEQLFPQLNVKCQKCGKKGHFRFQCKQDSNDFGNSELSRIEHQMIQNFRKFNIGNIQCILCSKKGHYSKDCNMRRKGISLNDIAHQPSTIYYDDLDYQEDDRANRNPKRNNVISNTRSPFINDDKFSGFVAAKEFDFQNDTNGCVQSKPFSRQNMRSQYTNIGGGRSDQCFKCNQVGHYAAHCPNNGNNNTRTNNSKFRSNHKGSAHKNKNKSKSIKKNKDFKNKQGYQKKVYTCYKCGIQGHLAPDCPNKGTSGGFSNKDSNVPKNSLSNFQNNQVKGGKQKLPCAQCGKIGKHSRGSTCTLIKRRNPNKKPPHKNSTEYNSDYDHGLQQ